METIMPATIARTRAIQAGKTPKPVTEVAGNG